MLLDSGWPSVRGLVTVLETSETGPLPRIRHLVSDNGRFRAGTRAIPRDVRGRYWQIPRRTHDPVRESGPQKRHELAHRCPLLSPFAPRTGHDRSQPTSNSRGSGRAILV